MCIRASVYPENYVNAQSICTSEGGSLLAITSKEIQVRYNVFPPFLNNFPLMILHSNEDDYHNDFNLIGRYQRYHQC